MKFSLSITAGILLCVFALGALSSCDRTRSIPAGYVGMCRTPDGFKSGQLLASGRHSCWGRDELYLIETSDVQKNIHLEVLCADQVNFKFDLGVLASIDKANVAGIKYVLENFAGSKTFKDGRYIEASALFDLYLTPIVDQEARKVVSKYKTTEIVANRSKIVEEVRAAVAAATKGGLLVVKRSTFNNDDYPKSVTMALENRLKREVEIETAKAEAQKKFIEAENELKLANFRYKVKLVEAKTIADSNKLIADSVSPGFLAYHKLKVLGEAAKGPNNWGFILDTAAPIGRFSSTGMVDAKLLKRLNNATGQ